MKTKRKINEGQIEKYLNALKELHLILNNTSKISLQKFCTSHNINNFTSRVLINGGIIKEKQKGANPLYEWVSIPPNKHMAVKLIEELRDINCKKVNKKEEPQVNANSEEKEINAKIVDFYEVKLFFGLITVKITPKYSKSK